jgi:UDP-2,3-diacylglucosamine hydrolase
MATYFISDIHLHTKSLLQQGLLQDFLRTYGPDADAIYILGDLFALWLGDDLAEEYAQTIFNELRKLAVMGVPLYFMRGNRDFLIGNKFSRATGCTILHDPCIINLYDQKVLLTHGDLLCTNDTNYQRFRRLVQNPLIKALFLLIPARLRTTLGLWVRSQVHKAARPDSTVYDVEQSTVNKWLDKAKTRILIHGHTHQGKIYDQGNTARIVLGDWNDQSAKILVCTPESFALQNLMD